MVYYIIVKIGLTSHQFAFTEKNSRKGYSRSHSLTRKGLPDTLPGRAVLLELICMCKRAELERVIRSVL
jgi:hypothetical protein